MITATGGRARISWAAVVARHREEVWWCVTEMVAQGVATRKDKEGGQVFEVEGKCAPAWWFGAGVGSGSWRWAMQRGGCSSTQQGECDGATQHDTTAAGRQMADDGTQRHDDWVVRLLTKKR